MSRLIILLVIASLAYLLWNELKRRNPEEQRKLLVQGGFWALLGVIMLLVATGRLHWIAAAITAAIPIIKGLLGLALRSLPFLQIWLRNRQQQTGQPPYSAPANNNPLAEDEAWQVLGLAPGASREDIIQAHKKLMQKLHPDRGGNDYLATKLNAARDLLLKSKRT